ncbi:hypothetical protein ACFY9F_36180 [Streptomyces sp. NPDC012421]|uniref:hypothetical protein n=1 Tax=Streptomyces sp. NPDC012421 TaxID=3364832 RepID=UPI0036EB771D
MADALSGTLSSLVTDVVESARPYLWWLLLLGAAGAMGWASGWVWWLRRARTALGCRTVVDLVPSRDFDPSGEEIGRHAARLARVPAAAGWIPRRASGVRMRHWSDGGRLATRLEGPAQSAGLLRLPSFPDVEVLEAGRSGGAVRPVRFAGVAPLAKDREEKP